MQGRKNEGVEDFRRNRERAQRTERLPKSRELKNRFRSKEVFLTDTQASDYTKSSGQMRGMKIEYLENQIKQLEKENKQLKTAMMNVKASSYLQINQTKVKELIQENQHLKQQINHIRKDYEQSLIERDFLQRFNKNLKNQCQALTKQILNMKAISSTSNHNIDQKNKFDYSQHSFHNSSSQQLSKLPFRSASTQILLTRKKQKKKRDLGINQQSSHNSKKNTNMNNSQLIEDYFVGGNQASSGHLAQFGARNKGYRQKY